MKELDTIVRAAVRVAKTRAEARRARDDGAAAEAQKRYGAAFSKALDELEKALESFAKAPKPAKPQGAPFDWMGAMRAIQAIVRVANRVKRGSKVEDVIEGEVIG